MTATWEPGLGDHLTTIWRHKWSILVAAAVVAEATCLVLLFLVPDRYEAESSIRLTIESDGLLLLDDDPVEYASRVYAELAESPAVLADVADRSELDLESVAKSVEVEWARPPGFIDIATSADTPEGAADLADAVAEALVGAVDAETERLADDADGADGDGARTVLLAQIVEPAIAPGAPASPRPFRDSAVVFVIALVVFAEVAAVWRPARGLLPLRRTAERVSELVGVPCLTLTGGPEDRTRLGLFAARHLRSKSAALLVHSSADPLPAVPIRLGEAMTFAGRRTLVVDGEAVEPSMHWWLGLPQAPGLQEVLAGRKALTETVFESQAKAEVALLTAGGTERTKPSSTGDVALERLKIEYDFVVAYLGSTAPLDGFVGAVAGTRKSTILVIEPVSMSRRRLADLFHSFGGHEDVVAILLMTKAATKADTSRLAARFWKRSEKCSSGSKSDPGPLRPFKMGRSTV